MFNGATILKDFNIAVCLKKIVTTLLAKSARNLLNNYLSSPRIAFFRMRRQAKKFPLAYLFQTSFRKGGNRDGARIREEGFI